MHLDYVDDDYQRLADQAQDIIRQDADLQPYYFEHGFTFIVDGKEGELNTLWQQMLENVKSKQPRSNWEQLNTQEEVFQNLHGKSASLVPEETLGHERRWQKGYTSKRCATVDAHAIVKVYYDRARSKPNVEFVLGTPVDRLQFGPDQHVKGVQLEDGRTFEAKKTILATGAWSSRLVKLDGVLSANAVGMAYIRLTDDEYEKYKDMGCHTNLVTGVNFFTPINGLLKILRRSTGIRNTTTLKDPEDETKTYRASYPRTAVDDPSQAVSMSFEQSLRQEMREFFPQLADRPFEGTRYCW